MVQPAAVKQNITILDDIKLVLENNLNVLKQQYSEVDLFTAKIAQTALNVVKTH